MVLRFRLPLLMAVLGVFGGCAVVPPPPAPALMALPGKGKDLAAFQRDDQACRGPAGSAPAAGLDYDQCMAAHGDIVQQAPYGAGYVAYPGFALAGVYPVYPAYPADIYDDGLFGPWCCGWGWGGWRGGWGRGGWGGGWGGGRGWGGGHR